ncbi:hypothetical protein [Leptospira interrogans]|uniref:hypothetical protein n=1 Tax=Leptospira interrogans TaxID=173 RepID=UPI001CE32252|nr:hypothetical protein [Leptospira interrogans]
MLTQQNAFLNSNLALPMVREIGRVNSAKRFLNSNLALPMVREIGRVNSAKRFPELKSRASYGPRDRSR